MINEVHHFGRTIALITKPSLQTSALLHHLKNALHIHIKTINIHKVINTTFSEDIILFDMMEANKALIHHWQDRLRQSYGIKILLLNTPEDYPFSDIQSWPHISGVFYSHATEHSLTEGLEMVMTGGCYFPPALSSYLIAHAGNYRYNNNNMESSILTQREKEILNRLRLGASNIEIAQSLFISESTVKTHLYNLFRKLSVKNRTQAVSWANDNFRR